MSSQEYSDDIGTLDGRVVLVTGASDGIGRAVAIAAAARGARVALLARTVRKLEAAYDAILAAGGPRPSICQFDLLSSAWKDYETLVQVLDAEYGRLDGLVHCAGLLGRLTPVEHIDPATWAQVLQVNVTAPFLLTRACLPLLRRSEDASIVFTSSTVGRRGRAYWGSYAVSKFATEGFMQVLADELASFGRIRVNSLNPGRTRTAMRHQAYPDEDPSTLPTPDAVAPAFLRLLSPVSRGVNGQALDAQ
jgi:NAD(P)-dependent dehydrogenase (short-subunit alcohol dehydrogenase family)